MIQIVAKAMCPRELYIKIVSGMHALREIGFNLLNGRI